MKLALNLLKSNNFAFFDPQSRLHVTVSSPVGIVDGATPAIERGLRSKAIILVDDEGNGHEIDLSNSENPQQSQEELSTEVPDSKNPAELQNESPDVSQTELPIEPPANAMPDATMAPAEPKKQTKKGRGKKSVTE